MTTFFIFNKLNKINPTNQKYSVVSLSLSLSIVGVFIIIAGRVVIFSAVVVILAKAIIDVTPEEDVVAVDLHHEGGMSEPR